MCTLSASSFSAVKPKKLITRGCYKITVLSLCWCGQNKWVSTKPFSYGTWLWNKHYLPCPQLYHCDQLGLKTCKLGVKWSFMVPTKPLSFWGSKFLREICGVTYSINFLFFFFASFKTVSMDSQRSSQLPNDSRDILESCVCIWTCLPQKFHQSS